MTEEHAKLLLVSVSIYLICFSAFVLYLVFSKPGIIGAYDFDIPSEDVKEIQKKLNEVLKDIDIKIPVNGVVDGYTYDSILLFRFRYESKDEKFAKYNNDMVDYIFGKYKGVFHFETEG